MEDRTRDGEIDETKSYPSEEAEWDRLQQERQEQTDRDESVRRDIDD